MTNHTRLFPNNLLQKVSKKLRQMAPAIFSTAALPSPSSLWPTCSGVAAQLMLPAVLSGAIISWDTCINELLSTSIILYTGRTATIAVARHQYRAQLSGRGGSPDLYPDCYQRRAAHRRV